MMKVNKVKKDKLDLWHSSVSYSSINRYHIIYQIMFCVNISHMIYLLNISYMIYLLNISHMIYLLNISYMIYLLNISHMVYLWQSICLYVSLSE